MAKRVVLVGGLDQQLDYLMKPKHAYPVELKRDTFGDTMVASHYVNSNLKNLVGYAVGTHDGKIIVEMLDDCDLIITELLPVVIGRRKYKYGEYEEVLVRFECEVTNG